MAFSPENNQNRKQPSIYDGLPYKLTREGFRAYDAEFYLRRLSRVEAAELGKSYGEIGIAENGIAVVQDSGKVIYFKGKSG